MYQVGYGVKQNSTESLNLLKKSAQQGYPPAKQILSRLQSQLKGNSSNDIDWGNVLGAGAAGAAALFLLLYGGDKETKPDNSFPYQNKPCGYVEFKGTYNCND